MGIYKKNRQKQRGFTMVEVIIVLAIVALIFVILFLTVDNAQKIRRDAARKDYANRVLAATEEFYKNNHHLPVCAYHNNNASQCPNAPLEAAKFLTSYMPEGSDPTTGQDYKEFATKLVTMGYCNGTATNSENVVYCWNDTSSFYINHNIMPRIGQIIIAATHVCTGGQVTSSPDPYGSGPIEDLSSGNNDDTDLSVVIGIEKGGYYCVSNGAFR
jgi:prepilin-type N-terminal cleavage/methylation domain-containing protein